jgi:CubicO group peptidase (beta-lactamase class C family)
MDSTDFSDSSSDLQHIDQVLCQEERQGFSGLILLRKKQQVLLARAYGWADKRSKKRMSMHTGIEIGSIVKPLTLAALLRLTETASVSLQDSLGKFFPTAPADKQAITLGMLVRHRAGLPDLFGSDYQLVDRDWLVKKVLNCRLVARPGSKQKYSNSGYSLLAALIEITTGMPYESFVRQEILIPAGAERIGYRLAGWRNEDLAVGYRRAGSRWGTPLDHPWLPDGPGWNLRGNGGMLALAGDLSAWYEALWHGRILGPGTLAQFLDIDAGESRAVGGMALGHAGGNGIFNCLQVCFFEPEIYLTLFSSEAGHQAEDIYRSFRPSLIALAKQADT